MAISPTPLTTISFAENNGPSHRLSSTTTTLVTEYTNSKPCPCSDLFETDLSPQHSRHPQSQTTYGKMPSVTMANSAHSGSCDGSSTTTSTTTSSSTNTTATTESTILSTWEPSPVVDTLPCQQTSPSATTVTARYEFTPGKKKKGPFSPLFTSLLFFPCPLFPTNHKQQFQFHVKEVLCSIETEIIYCWHPSNTIQGQIAHLFFCVA